MISQNLKFIKYAEGTEVNPDGHPVYVGMTIYEGINHDLIGQPIIYQGIPQPWQICPRGYGDVNGVCSNPVTFCCMNEEVVNVKENNL